MSLLQALYDMPPPLRMGVDLVPMTNAAKVPGCADPGHRPAYSEWLWDGLHSEDGSYIFVRVWDDIAELVEYAHNSCEGILIKEDEHDVMEVW